MPEEYCAGGTPLAAASIYQQLEKILASKLFHGSPQISRFLGYTVRHTLQGEGDQLKEYRVGVDIFGRRSSYDPHQDPVVRQEARRLRAKLREYYEDQGRYDPIRIDVPKGGYAATFAAHGQRDVMVFGEYSQGAPANRHVIFSRKLKIGLTATISLAAVLLAGWEIGRSRRNLPDIGSPSALSVAVLPLRNLSGDPSQEYLADGITDSLIANLSRLPGLQVIARTTAFRYKGKDADPEKVGQDLHVNEVLTGTLLERGDMVIVQLELVDVAKNSLLWHAQYTRRTVEIQSVEGDIVRAVSERLERPLSSEQASQLAARRTDNTEAFQMYLMGRFNLNKRTEEGFTKAIEYFGQAIDKDPEYALAYAGRADCYILLAEYTVLPSDDALPQATAATTKALQLDDTLAEAHASLGAVKVDHEWDWQGAEKEFRRAIELNPSYATAHQWYAELLSQEGRHDEAIAEIKRAKELDPLSLIVNSIAGRILLFAGQSDGAIEQLHKTLEIDPNFSIANYDLGKAYLQKGMLSRAIEEFQRSVNLFRVSERDAALGYAYARAGQYTEARKVLRTYLQESKRTYVSWYGIAFIYAGLTDKDQAFACLEKAAKQHDVRLRDLKEEPLFVSMRSDPRFTLLLNRVGL